MNEDARMSPDPVAGPPTARDDAAPPVILERRRPKWSEFRRAYPGILVTMTIAVVIMLAVDAWLVARMVRYGNEVDRLRAGMTSAERNRADLLLETEENKFKVMLELIRRQWQGDKTLNIAISVDSGTMYLGREGAILREMKVEVGPEKTVGTSPDTVRMTPPRGQRTVERIMDGNDVWEVPVWVYTDRGLPVPEDRKVKGALGPHAIILNGGTVVYSLPSDGPLADSAWVMPGSIRAKAADVKAIAPNLTAGMSVYVY